MKEIEIKLLAPAEVAEAVTLDKICLGGLWKEEAYLREIDSDKSTLVTLHLSKQFDDYKISADVFAVDPCKMTGNGAWHQCLHKEDRDANGSVKRLRHRSKIIGMGCLWSIVDEAHITLLAIHPDYRRQGLGQLLLFNLLEDALARQLEWATLEVNENNSNALNLYQKYGFLVAGKRKNYYQPQGDDALVLWLKNIQQQEFRSSLTTWQQQLRDRLSKNSYYLK